ncbi:MAG: hypothetical protein RIT27_1889 [Pseudomonadota bacterium]|jgi:hypothetical protein
MKRRQFLQISVALIGFTPLLLEAKNIQMLKGDVKVNGKPITKDANIKANDMITTGENSALIFFLNKDVHRLGSNARLELEGENKLIDSMRLITGGLMSVFEKGSPRSLQVTSATIGVRGTGFYCQIYEHQTYFCTCYGTTEIETVEGERTIQATHHRPYLIDHKTGEFSLPPADLKNHTDEELIYLESLMNRQPPDSFLDHASSY